MALLLCFRQSETLLLLPGSREPLVHVMISKSSPDLCTCCLLTLCDLRGAASHRKLGKCDHSQMTGSHMSEQKPPNRTSV